MGVGSNLKGAGKALYYQAYALPLPVTRYFAEQAPIVDADRPVRTTSFLHPQPPQSRPYLGSAPGGRSPKRGAAAAAPAAQAYTRKQLGAAAPAVLAMAYPAYSHAALREMLDLHAGDVPAALDMLAQLEGAGAGDAPADSSKQVGLLVASLAGSDALLWPSWSLSGQQPAGRGGKYGLFLTL